MKVLANDGISASGKKKLEEAGFEVTIEKVEQDHLIDAINENNYEVLLVRSATKVRKDIIDACSNLKMIGRGGVGMDNIDVEYARDKGIKVFNTPAASSQSVAELVLGHMFTLARSLHDANRQMPDKGDTLFKDLKKRYAKSIELRGKTLGIIGFGRIGEYLAKYATGIGMKVIGHDPGAGNYEQVMVELFNGESLKLSISLLSKAEILKQSDFLSLHVPAQKDGSYVIGEEEFKQMKEGAFLINAARGGVVDEEALIRALDNGKLTGAALDVFENEPTPDKKVLEHPAISLTPHTGAATMEAQDRIGLELADNIIDFYQD